MNSVRSVLTLTVVALAAVMACAGSANAQLVVGNAPSTAAQGEMKVFDLSGASGPRLLHSGIQYSAITAGLDTDNTTPALYWAKSNTARVLFKAPLTTSGLLVPTPSAGVGPLIAQMTGMAFDPGTVTPPVPPQLVAVRSSGIGTLSINDASFSSVFSTSLLSGIAYDPSADVFYVYNNSATAGFPQGSGIYRMNKPLSAPTFSKVSDRPAGDIGVINLAYGNGRLFLVRAVSAAPLPQLYIYNIAAGVYESGAPTLTFASNTGSIAGVSWVPGLVALPTGTDLAITAGASQDCEVAVGGTLNYGIHVENYGATASGPVTVTISLPSSSVAAFASSSPQPTSSTSSTLTYVLPAISGHGPGAYADIVIQLTAVMPGATSSITATVATTSDDNAANDVATAASSIQPVVMPTAAAKGVLTVAFSRDYTAPLPSNALVPGSATEHFVHTTGTMQSQPVRVSSDGDWWSVLLPTDGPADANEVIVRTQVGQVPTLVLRKGASVADGTITRLYEQSVNQTGEVVFTGRSGSSASSTGFAGRTNGISVNDVLREGQPYPAGPVGTLYASDGSNSGGTLSTAMNDGTLAAFWLASANNQSTFIAGSSAVVAVGQTVTGSPGPFQGPLTGSSFAADPDGGHHIYLGRFENGVSTFARMVVVDGAAVLRLGVTVLPGYTSPVAEVTNVPVAMASGGRWSAVGNNVTSSEQWGIIGVGSQIERIIKSGDPIHTTSSERWASASFGYIHLGPDEHYLVLNTTDAADTFANQVLVYDNQLVVARENDPVDLDGNGIFDDGVYIKSINNRPAILSDGSVLFGVLLRNTASALCKLNDDTVGSAIVRVVLPVPPMVNCCRGTTCIEVAAGSCTGTVAGSNSVEVAACTGNTVAGCCFGDYDHNGTKDITDIFTFLNAWFGASSYADITSNGSSTPDITDIFTFLNAWFGTCG